MSHLLEMLIVLGSHEYVDVIVERGAVGGVFLRSGGRYMLFVTLSHVICKEGRITESQRG